METCIRCNAKFEGAKCDACAKEIDARSEEQFTIVHLDGTSMMNHNTYKIEQQALESRRSLGRYQLEEAAVSIHKATGERALEMRRKLIAAAFSHALPVYEPGKFSSMQFGAGHTRSVHHYHEEAYWCDLNKWLEKNDPLIGYEFPNPDPSAAKATERLPVATQQNDAILNWLKSKNYDPLKLPVPPSGKAGVKKLCRDDLCATCKQLFSSGSVFRTAWDRLRTNTAIIDAQ